MNKKVVVTFLLLAIAAFMLPVSASVPEQLPVKGRILFVPHDGRPISDAQTVEVVRKLGYDVEVPPQDMLGSRDDLGNPDALLAWTEEHIKDADAAVLSSDSLLYGSLVGSRKHSYDAVQVEKRIARLAALHQANPGLKLYVFGSIMRTPSTGANAGSEEPDYYMRYGNDIFRCTALCDKQETAGLSVQEQQELDKLQASVPAEYMQDWLGRRSKNFAANKQLIDFVRANTFEYFILGKDDNAPLSQTHKESRALQGYSAGLDKSRFQIMTGIDEMGLLLLTRAVNDRAYHTPLVYVCYNQGVGGSTIPAYSDEPIEISLRSAIAAAGGLKVTNPQHADFVLVVNTNPDGRTLEANTPVNDGQPRVGTKYIADMVADYLAAGYPVGLADVAFANGADNALMKVLRDRNLLFKLRAYAGWNTATNSSGFVLGTGMLAADMNDAARDQLLLRRYLDDWAYQANVRTVLGKQLRWFRESDLYSTLGKKCKGTEVRAAQLMRNFAADNLPPFFAFQGLRMHFPWDRMFESEIIMDNGN